MQSVSVIIPTYNRARFVERSLRSVLAAIAPGDEIIVVDDASTDNTAEVLEPYRDQIRYLRVPHGGVGAARNRGIEAAEHPLVAFNDSDDEWFVDRLALQRPLMAARPDVLFCFSNFGVRATGFPERHFCLNEWHWDSRSWSEILGAPIRYSTIAPLPAGRADFNLHIGDLYPAQMRNNYVPAQTALVRREEAGDAFRFSEDLKIHEDQECFVRLAHQGNAAYLDCETFWQWGHDGPRVSQAREFDWATDRITLLQRNYGADTAFLIKHWSLYEQLLQTQYLTLAKCRLREGETREARQALRLAGGGPLSYRVLAALPGAVLHGAVRLRRHLLHAVQH